MDANSGCLRTPPPLSSRPPARDTEPISTTRALGCQRYKQRGSPKERKGYQDGQVSLIQKPVWLVLEKEGAVTQNKGWYCMLLKKDCVGGVDEWKELKG